MNRVLIVDADPGVCQGLQAQLQQRGVEVVTRSSVIEALKLLDSDAELDCVIAGLDASADGDLCDRMASTHSGIPVVMATDHLDTESAMAALRMGANDVIQKPIAPDALCEALDRVSSRRKRTTDGEISASNDGSHEGELVPLEEIERRYMQRVLNACRGNKTLAAKILQVNRRTLARKFGGPVRRAAAEG